MKTMLSLYQKTPEIQYNLHQKELLNKVKTMFNLASKQMLNKLKTMFWLHQKKLLWKLNMMFSLCLKNQKITFRPDHRELSNKLKTMFRLHPSLELLEKQKIMTGTVLKRCWTLTMTATPLHLRK
uniref:Uncharacterized protein n=1 Tax=Opuntia streptacantha TaxID=393608 RepID=A0A7C9EUN0_OPUST